MATPLPSGGIANELRARGLGLVEEATAIGERAAHFRRPLTPSESAQQEALTAEAQELMERIVEIEAGEKRGSELEDSFRKVTGHEPRAAGATTRDGADVVDEFRSMLLEGNPKPIFLTNQGQRSNYMPGVEARNLSLTSPANMTPTSFYDRIFEHAVANAAVLKAGATVLNTTTGEDLRVSRSTARSTAAIVAEAAVIPESDPTLSSVVLKAYKLAFLVTVSHELLTDSGVNLEEYIARQAGEAIGIGLNGYAVNGTGSGQPRGVLLDATAGATGPTGTSTTLGAQATAGQGTDLLNNLSASVAAGYLNSPSAGFLLSPSAQATIRNIKATTTGEPIGTQFVADSPWPYFVDDNVPAMAANAKSILFGDWSRVAVRIAEGMRFERSDHFKYSTDEVTFRAIMRFDSALINVDAIKYFANSAT